MIPVLQTVALKNINLHVKPGQLVMIVGPVGAGKVCESE